MVVLGFFLKQTRFWQKISDPIITKNHWNMKMSFAYIICKGKAKFTVMKNKLLEKRAAGKMKLTHSNSYLPTELNMEIIVEE